MDDSFEVLQALYESFLSIASETGVVSEPKFRCDVCSYSSDKKYNLDRHNATHTDKKNPQQSSLK